MKYNEYLVNMHILNQLPTPNVSRIDARYVADYLYYLVFDSDTISQTRLFSLYKIDSEKAVRMVDKTLKNMNKIIDFDIITEGLIIFINECYENEYA